MRKIVLALAVVASALLSPLPAAAQLCSGCIHNQSTPENAQINIGTAVIRGTLTVSTISVTNLSIVTLTATNIVGSGAGITTLNASQLTSGTVPNARLTGSYTGITGLGTITSGAWQGTPVATQYGGTGQNFVTVGAGSILYFSNTGVMSTVQSPSFLGVLESTGTGGTPVWVSSPAIQGYNFTNIPLTALQSGTLSGSIAVTDASLTTIAAVKVVGNITGGASFLTVPLPISNLAAGTLPTSNAASSITVTGVTPIVCGGPTQLCQVNIHSDGRVYAAMQSSISIPPSALQGGAIPANVTLPANQLTPGAWPSNVIVSSLAATGITVTSYGGPAKTLVLTPLVDGRIAVISAPNISLPLAQLESGTLASGIKLPAASVLGGSLLSTVVASSLAANGVTPGTYGSTSGFPQITIGADGRVTSATALPFTGITGASNTVTTDVDGFVPNAQLNPDFVTKAGNNFNEAGQLVQLTITGALPVLSGENLTDLQGAEVVGPVASANALSAPGTAASSGFLCRGVDASGNCLPALVDSSAVASSTNPVQSGAMFTALAAKASTGTDNSMTRADALATLGTSSGVTVVSTLTIQGSDFSVAGTTFVVTNGRVLIGTNAITTSAQIHVVSENSPARIVLQGYGTNNAPHIVGRFARGSQSAPTAAQAGDTLLQLVGVGWNGSEFSTSTAPGMIRVVAAETHSATAAGASVRTFTTPNGSTTTVQRMIVNQNGRVGISTGAPQSLLDVNGSAQFGSSGVSTFTSAGVLQLVAGGILWADGSTSTTGASGSGISVYLAGTGTLSINGSGSGNSAAGDFSVNSGGLNNSISAAGDFAGIGGGELNQANAAWSRVGGGSTNIASGSYATVPGGFSNEASGSQSFAAGNRAKATASGSFVWADGQLADFVGATVDEFRLRAQGGFYVEGGISSFGSGATRSTFTAPGALNLASGANVTLSGSGVLISSGISTISGNLGLFIATSVFVNGNVVGTGSGTFSGVFGDGTTMTGVMHEATSGGFSSTLALGTTFMAHVPLKAIVLNRITATVVVPGIGGAGDTYRCQSAGGTGISVTVAAAAAAGSVTSATGSASLTAGTTFFGLLHTSAAATSPVVNLECAYTTP